MKHVKEKKSIEFLFNALVLNIKKLIKLDC